MSPLCALPCRTPGREGAREDEQGPPPSGRQLGSAQRCSVAWRPSSVKITQPAGPCAPRKRPPQSMHAPCTGMRCRHHAPPHQPGLPACPPVRYYHNSLPAYSKPPQPVQQPLSTVLPSLPTAAAAAAAASTPVPACRPSKHSCRCCYLRATPLSTAAAGPPP